MKSTLRIHTWQFSELVGMESQDTAGRSKNGILEHLINLKHDVQLFASASLCFFLNTQYLLVIALIRRFGPRSTSGPKARQGPVSAKTAGHCEGTDVDHGPNLYIRHNELWIKSRVGCNCRNTSPILKRG